MGFKKNSGSSLLPFVGIYDVGFCGGGKIGVPGRTLEQGDNLRQPATTSIVLIALSTIYKLYDRNIEITVKSVQ